jgi:hypothetical protein
MLQNNSSFFLKDVEISNLKIVYQKNIVVRVAIKV